MKNVSSELCQVMTLVTLNDADQYKSSSRKLLEAEGASTAGRAKPLVTVEVVKT
jgi:hypothetical protein